MSDLLRAIRLRPRLRLRELTPTVVRDDADDKVVRVAWRAAKGTPLEHVEGRVWEVPPSRRELDGPVILVESGVHRGPAWDCGDYQVQRGDYLSTFALKDDAWAAWTAGAMTPRDLMKIATNWSQQTSAAAAVPDPKGTNVKHATASKAAALAALRLPAQGAGAIFKQLEDELAKAKEAYEKNPSRANESKMQEAGRRVVTAKLMAQENAREQDMAHLARSIRGQGTPLFTSTHSIGATPAVRFVR